jgi:PAS domain-containing protein
MAERLGIFARRNDGTEFPVEVSLFPVQTPNGPQVAVSIRDITKENQASQSVRNMASIIESSNDSISSVNMEMSFTSWNAAAERMYVA